MAYIDNELFCFQDKACAASMTSSVMDLGNSGGFAHPLYFDVKLTAALTSGSLDTIKVQSSADEAFSSTTEEMSVTIPSSIGQTDAPATLAQFFAPIKTSNRYVRLQITGTSPVGGTVSAYMANGVAVSL